MRAVCTQKRFESGRFTTRMKIRTVLKKRLEWINININIHVICYNINDLYQPKPDAPLKFPSTTYFHFLEHIVLAAGPTALLGSQPQLRQQRLNFINATWRMRNGIDMELPPHFLAMRQHLPTKSSSIQQLNDNPLNTLELPLATWISMSLLS